MLKYSKVLWKTNNQGACPVRNEISIREIPVEI